MKWFKVELHSDGSVKAATETNEAFQVSKRVFVLQAESAVDAAKRAREIYNRVCADRVKADRARRKAEGKCACGRPRNRPHPLGGTYQNCAVCAARIEACRENARQRPVTQPRNEHAKAAACTARVRDRKQEMRLEVLTEVKQAWEDSRNNQAFTRWLSAELAKALAPAQPAAAEVAVG